VPGPLLAGSVIAPALPNQAEVTAGIRELDGDKARDEVLPADLVLKRLMQSLKPDPPPLLTNPLQFFVEHLTESFPPDSAERDTTDLLRFEFTIRKIDVGSTAASTPSSRCCSRSSMLPPRGLRGRAERGIRP
jgi:hypothetical protein